LDGTHSADENIIGSGIQKCRADRLAQRAFRSVANTVTKLRRGVDGISGCVQRDRTQEDAGHGERNNSTRVDDRFHDGDKNLDLGGLEKNLGKE
jgi:hypothetical protein